MTLPIPDLASLAHSEKLVRHIRDEIEANKGHISFAHYMKLALYAPGLGYYSAGTHKLGKGGDFVTAPELTPLFARCIAKQCQQVLSQITDGTILELGAGTGVFAKDLLLELEKLHSLPEFYFILETSADLRERQKQLLKAECPHLLSRIAWLDSLPKKAIKGVIFANEVMDAMPIHCFQVDDVHIERSVGWRNNSFTWVPTQPSPELTERIEILKNEYHLPQGYESEINLDLSAWIKSLAKLLKKGLLLLIDYGYGRAEYFHPERNTGTLMCFYQHHYHDNPFLYPGLQDITAHVDFTTIVESGVDANLNLAGFTTQASFLLACGLLELAQNEQLSATELYRQNQAIKTLTLPSQMGDLIKVIGLSKNLDQRCLGFLLQDRSRDL